METFFKNEVKKARSLQYFNIFRQYMAKYDHLVYYPFRSKLKESYDLLKPKGSFFTLILTVTLATVWMLTVFITFILSSGSSNISEMSIGSFVGVAIAIAIMAAVINFFAI